MSHCQFYNAGQNIRQKFKKPSKIGPEQKTLIIIFAYFLTALAKKSLIKNRLLENCSSQFKPAVYRSYFYDTFLLFCPSELTKKF